MNVPDFIHKWSKARLTETSASQQHFLDLCELFTHPKPASLDPTGDSFTFEKGAAKHGGGEGWADVWKKGYFGWEYKGKHKDLDKAYDQLLKYREALENPPILVVCDLDRFVIRTNFTATATQTHEFTLDELAQPRNLEILRHVFHNPDKLKPGATSEHITREAADTIGDIAQRLRAKGHDPRDVAHFLDRLVFSLFAEDIELLPDMLLTRLLEKCRTDPERFTKSIAQLFDVMAEGGDFGINTIECFNGNLFEEGPILELEVEDIESLFQAARLDWGAVDPSIFGTLFERGLDPAKRAQLGAHYTSREDIETLVDPVVMQPLRRKWTQARQTIDNLLTTGKKNRPGTGGGRTTDHGPRTTTAAGPGGRQTTNPLVIPAGGREGGGDPDGSPPGAGGGRSTIHHPPSTPPLTGPKLKKALREANTILRRFLEDLAHVKVLDPACGSGNFLYVTLQKLKDLEKQAIVFGMDRGLTAHIPLVGPWQLYGIEINPYAHELAQMTVWIGYLQWIKANGFGSPDSPILRRMDNFECRDAILDLTDPENPKEPEWPQVDYIVSNPPFLGNRLMKGELGEEYVEALAGIYQKRLGGRPDLCCYWFEKAREHLVDHRVERVGLLATQGIRGGTNRKSLKAVKESGEIFFANSDRPWILDGANVHVSMVGFDDGSEPSTVLDGHEVEAINSNLTTGPDVTDAKKLPANKGIGFQGAIKRGKFDLPEEEALALIRAGGNPHGRPNSDVLRPYVNGADITRRNRRYWIVDLGLDTTESEASLYGAPFAHVLDNVKPDRQKARQKAAREIWWRHWNPRRGMRSELAGLERFLATTTVSKHRLFVWLDQPVLPDHQLIAFARSDDTFFGILHSRIHEVWALALGTQLRERESGFRYTPTTCFETFPFPDATPEQVQAIAAAARELNDLREEWLNPKDWTRDEILEFPGSTDGPWAKYLQDPDSDGIGTVRYPRTVPREPIANPDDPDNPETDFAALLTDRTLTKLYNQRPTWLHLAHQKLDQAVFAAYGWDPELTDEELLEKLLELNLERAT